MFGVPGCYTMGRRVTNTNRRERASCRASPGVARIYLYDHRGDLLFTGPVPINRLALTPFPSTYI